MKCEGKSDLSLRVTLHVRYELRFTSGRSAEC